MIIRHPVYDPSLTLGSDVPDVTYAVRIEETKPLGYSLRVTRELLEDSRSRDFTLRRTYDELRAHLDRAMTRLGRLPVGEAVITESEDFIRNAVIFRAVVETRESDQGEWPSIYAALREDEEDRHPPVT